MQAHLVNLQGHRLASRLALRAAVILILLFIPGTSLADRANPSLRPLFQRTDFRTTLHRMIYVEALNRIYFKRDLVTLGADHQDEAIEIHMERYRSIEETLDSIIDDVHERASRRGSPRDIHSLLEDIAQALSDHRFRYAVLRASHISYAFVPRQITDRERNETRRFIEYLEFWREMFESKKALGEGKRELAAMWDRILRRRDELERRGVWPGSRESDEFFEAQDRYFEAQERYNARSDRHNQKLRNEEPEVDPVGFIAPLDASGMNINELSQLPDPDEKIRMTKTQIRRYKALLEDSDHGYRYADCDTLAMIYAAVLETFGIESYIMAGLYHAWLAVTDSAGRLVHWETTASGEYTPDMHVSSMSRYAWTIERANQGKIPADQWYSSSEHIEENWSEFLYPKPLIYFEPDVSAWRLPVHSDHQLAPEYELRSAAFALDAASRPPVPAAFRKSLPSFCEDVKRAYNRRKSDPDIDPEFLALESRLPVYEDTGANGKAAREWAGEHESALDSLRLYFLRGFDGPALHLANQLIDAGAGSPFVRFVKAVALHGLGRSDEAWTVIKDLDDDAWLVQLYQAEILLYRGRLEEAKSRFRLASIALAKEGISDGTLKAWNRYARQSVNSVSGHGETGFAPAPELLPEHFSNFLWALARDRKRANRIVDASHLKRAYFASGVLEHYGAEVVTHSAALAPLADFFNEICNFRQWSDTEVLLSIADAINNILSQDSRSLDEKTDRNLRKSMYFLRITRYELLRDLEGAIKWTKRLQEHYQGDPKQEEMQDLLEATLNVLQVGVPSWDQEAENNLRTHGARLRDQAWVDEAGQLLGAFFEDVDRSSIARKWRLIHPLLDGNSDIEFVREGGAIHMAGEFVVRSDPAEFRAGTVCIPVTILDQDDREEKGRYCLRQNNEGLIGIYEGITNDLEHPEFGVIEGTGSPYRLGVQLIPRDN